MIIPTENIEPLRSAEEVFRQLPVFKISNIKRMVRKKMRAPPPSPPVGGE